MVNNTMETSKNPYDDDWNFTTRYDEPAGTGNEEPTGQLPTFDPDLNCVRRYNSKTKTYYIYEGYSGIPENLTFALVTWLVVVIIFIFIRRHTLGRTRNGVTRDEVEGYTSPCRKFFVKYFGWIIFTLKLGDQQIAGKCGPDAILYLVFQRYLIVYMIIVCVLSLGLVLPINYQGTLVADATHFGRTTIANIDGNSPFLWIHVGVALVYLVLAILFMRRFKKYYLSVRKEAVKTRTLILTNLPPGYNLEMALVEYFRESYQDTFVEAFSQAYDVTVLSNINAKRRRMRDLRELSEEIHASLGVRQYMWTRSCGCCSPCCTRCCREVDAVEYFGAEESRQTSQYHSLLTRTLSRPLDIAFVTFTTEAAAQRVWCVLSHPLKVKDRLLGICRSCCSPIGEAAELRRCGPVYYAPEPEDIYWENLAQSREWWWTKAVLLNLLFLVLLFIVTTPSVIMNTLDDWHSWETIERFSSPVLTRVAPVLVLWTFSALLPAAVSLTESQVGHWTRSKEQQLITNKTFVFLLMMILILPSLGLTSAKALIQWLMDRHTAEVRWSCIFLPDNGAFFVNYVITACFIGTSLRLLRIWDLLCLIVRLMFARCAAEREMAWKSLTCDFFRYGVEYAWVMVLFCTIVSYSVSVPLITPIGLLYLLAKHFVDRHNIYYAFTMETRMSSEPHHKAVAFVHTAAILLQCNVIAFILLRAEGVPPPPAIVALTVLVGGLVYLFSRYIMACVRRAVKVFVNVKDMESGLASGTSFVYIPSVLLLGTTPVTLRKSIAPRVTVNDL